MTPPSSAERGVAVHLLMQELEFPFDHDIPKGEGKIINLIL
jgi:hypothetical protein